MNYAVFDKTFVDVVRVTAHTDRAGLSGTGAEQHLVDALAAPVMRTDLEDVPDVATLLFGPIARGTEVSVR